MSSNCIYLCVVVIVLQQLSSDGSSFVPAWNKYEFKVRVDAGKNDCFFQAAVNGSMLHVSFQLLRGNDVSFVIKEPNGLEIIRWVFETRGSHQVQHVPYTGDYQICIENSYSHLMEKIVYIYILTFHPNELKQKFENEKNFNESSTLITKSTNKINLDMLEVFTHQALGRFRQSRDEYLSDANNKIVLYWSLVQSIVIVLCGVFQVYFIKKLFRCKQ